MIAPFAFNNVPEIVFGPGSFSQLGGKLLEFGKSLLLVTGGKSFQDSKYFSILFEQINSCELSCSHVQIKREPSPEDINTIVAEHIDLNIEVVVAIGGGSCLDAGKALSAMLVEKRDVSLFLEGIGSQQPSGNKLPFIAIPTTSGTGSETTANAVLSSVGKTGFKKSLRHSNYMPNLAIVDPLLTLSCPKSITASCGMDCFTQLVEAYLSTKGSPLTDLLALDGVHAVFRSLNTAYHHGDNLEARCDLSYATLLSGIVLTNAGLGTVHGFASAIGGLHPVPHGVICGTLMAEVNNSTLHALRKLSPGPEAETEALGKFSKLGKILSGKDNQQDHWYQDYFVEALQSLADELDIQLLAHYGVKKDDLEAIVSLTTNKYNPVQLTDSELKAILNLRL